MSRSRCKIQSGLAVAAIVAMTSCASVPPPTADLSAARNLVERAREGIAAGVGAVEVRRAESWIRDAEALIAAKRYADALLLARRAAASAELALARQRAARAEAALSVARAEHARIEREFARGERK